MHMHARRHQAVHKVQTYALATSLLFAGAAIDRGLNLVNWELIKLGLIGASSPICSPPEKAVADVPKQQTPSENEIRPRYQPILPNPETPFAINSPVPIALPALAPPPNPMSPMRPDKLVELKSLGAKPPATTPQTQAKDKDEPGVNVDLTKGKKEVVSEAIQK